MKKKKEPKTKRVATYVTVSEYEALQHAFQNSACREFPEYVRLLLKKKPVVKKYRNMSLDDILQCLIEIKAGIESTDWNFAKLTAKLLQLPPGVISKEIMEFLLTEEFNFRMDAQDTKRKLIKIYETCLQRQTPPLE
jgi:hypothetical protein